MRTSLTALRNGRTGFTLIEIVTVVLIIGVLLAIAMPSFIQARDKSRAKACIENLQAIDSAKLQYMMDNHISMFFPETPLGPSDPEALIGPKLYIRVVPQCPSGGTYNTGDEAGVPMCSYGTSDGTLFGHVYD